MSTRLSPSLRAAVLAAALVTAMFALACRLLSQPLPGGVAAGQSAAVLLLGGGRQVLGTDLYRRADTYFHLGVEHMEGNALAGDPFQRLLSDVAPARHAHLEGDRVRDIMPWLRLATAADPHNVDAYLVAAFWLATAARDTAAAERVLAEAQRNNPGDYRVFLEESRLRLRTRDWARALPALLAARSCWPRPTDAADLQTQLDKGELLTYLALLKEGAGDAPGAAEALQEAVQLFPSRSNLVQRLAELDAGKAPEVPAYELLNRLTRLDEHRACPREAGAETETGGPHDHDEHEKHEGAMMRRAQEEDLP